MGAMPGWLIALAMQQRAALLWELQA